MSLGHNFGVAILTVDDPPAVVGHCLLVDCMGPDIAVACLVDVAPPKIAPGPWTRDAIGERPISDIERLTVRRWAPISSWALEYGQ
jgi:hypothetical protein